MNTELARAVTLADQPGLNPLGLPRIAKSYQCEYIRICPG